MAGRKRKPAEMHALHGDPGKRKRDKAVSSGVKIEIPKMPAWLPPKAKTAWRELAPLLFERGVITRGDRVALEALVDAYSIYRDARRVMEKEGMTYECRTKDGGTMVRKRGEVSIAFEAQKRLQSLLSEFGLTPAARSKVDVLQAAAEDPYEAYRKRNLKPA